MADERKPLRLIGFGLVAVAGFMLLRGKSGAAVVDPTKPLLVRARYSLRSPIAWIDGAIRNWDAIHAGVPVLDTPDSSGLNATTNPALAGPAATIGFAPFGSTLSPAPGAIRSGRVAWQGQSDQFVPVIWPLDAMGARTAYVNQGDLQ